jgi:hypothetical protein
MNLNILMGPMDRWETSGKTEAASKSGEIFVLRFHTKKLSLEVTEEHGLITGDLISKTHTKAQLPNAINCIN